MWLKKGKSKEAFTRRTITAAPMIMGSTAIGMEAAVLTEVTAVIKENLPEKNQPQKTSQTEKKHLLKTVLTNRIIHGKK